MKNSEQASTDPASVGPQLAATFAIIMIGLSIVARPDGSNVSLHKTLLPPTQGQWGQEIP